MSSNKFHYALLIALFGMTAIFACLGIGRFTIGMILPSMSDSLKLSYSQMGIISAGNFFGYLFAVLISSQLLKFLTPRIIIFCGLILICVCMLLISIANTFSSIFLLYSLTGFGSGSVNVPVMSLVKVWFTGKYRGKAAGIITIGSGFAIMLSGWLIPFVNTHFALTGWRVCWRILSSIVLLCAATTIIFIRNKPEDLNIKAYGYKPDIPIPKNELAVSVYKNIKTYYIGLIYALFGFTYSVYVTFVVTYAVRELNYSEQLAGRFWFVIGLLSLLSGPVFGEVSDRFGRKAGLISVFSLQAISYITVVLNPTAFYFSVVLFGVTAWSIPAIITAVASDNYPAAQMPAAFGFITFIFGIGQISGPAAAGKIAEYYGSFKYAFLMIAVFTLAAVAISFFLKNVKNKEF